MFLRRHLGKARGRSTTSENAFTIIISTAKKRPIAMSRHEPHLIQYRRTRLLRGGRKFDEAKHTLSDDDNQLHCMYINYTR